MIVLLTAPTDILSSMMQQIVSGEPAAIAVAFWGDGACKEMGLAKAAPGTRILLNADSGACNPDELRILLGMRNLNVRNAPRLHAKVVIGRDKIVLGSANASANGLGFQGWAGWTEACVETADRRAVAEAKKWFDAQWAATEEGLSESTIERAERVAKRLQAHVAAIQRARRRPKTIASLEELRTARIFVAVTDEEADFSAHDLKKMAAAFGIKVPAEVDYYQSWSSIPTHALLIAIDADKERGAGKLDDYWLSSDGRSVRVPGVGRGYPVIKASAADLAEWGLTPVIRWEASIGALMEVFRTKRGLGSRLQKESPGRVQYRRPTDWCIPLADMLQLCIEFGLPVPAEWRATMGKNGDGGDSTKGATKAQRTKRTMGTGVVNRAM